MSKYNKINIAVIGATGYTGLDLVLLLSKHPRVKIRYLCATKNLGKDINLFDKRIKKKLPKISLTKKIDWKILDLVFLSLPNGEAQKLIKKRFYKNKKLKFIDLSADFRVSNTKIYVNGKLFDEYFVSENHKMQITRPFEIINQATEYDVRCSVTGGGHTGQAGAMVHGISKALVMFDEKLKTTLKTESLTTRDPRAVERKKPGRRKARRSFQFSKR